MTSDVMCCSHTHTHPPLLTLSHTQWHTHTCFGLFRHDIRCSNVGTTQKEYSSLWIFLGGKNLVVKRITSGILIVKNQELGFSCLETTCVVKAYHCEFFSFFLAAVFFCWISMLAAFSVWKDCVVEHVTCGFFFWRKRSVPLWYGAWDTLICVTWFNFICATWRIHICIPLLEKYFVKRPITLRLFFLEVEVRVLLSYSSRHMCVHVDNDRNKYYQKKNGALRRSAVYHD